MKVSLILASYKRANLLNLGLKSIALQKIEYPLEIIVVNDGIKDGTKKICQKYSKLHIKYIFSGKRNLKEEQFRSPSIALNIGIKKAKGDIVILSNPEIFHLNSVVNLLVEPLLNNEHKITSAKVEFDNTGEIRDYLLEKRVLPIPEEIASLTEKDTVRCKYASRLPFCIGIHKERLIEIGGYDEDFTGWGADDDDLMQRLIANGNTYDYTEAKVIHLYHDKQYERGNRQNTQFLHNYQLYLDRKNQIIRNEGREWGIL